jgi:serine/threonine protein kinase
MLLNCRHPNILFMLGFALDFPAGPVLVMEKAWGAVAAALPLPVHTAPRHAMNIAVQVLSALHYLHERKISHGSLGIHTVLLIQSPQEGRATAKLANFSKAKDSVTEVEVFRGDLLRLGAFMCNLFAKEFRGELDEISAQDVLPTMEFFNAEFDGSFPGMRPLLQWVLTQRASVGDLVTRFTEMMTRTDWSVDAQVNRGGEAEAVFRRQSTDGSQDRAVHGTSDRALDRDGDDSPGSFSGSPGISHSVMHL